MKSLQNYSYLQYCICKDQRIKILKTNSVNPLYFMLNEMNGYCEEINGNKYLTLVSTNESKNRIKKYNELWLKLEI